MSIDYEHARNRHTVEGPSIAFPHLISFLPEQAKSFVDVGCGTGTWLKAALENGFDDAVGIDGIALPPEKLAVPPAIVLQRDLTQPLRLGRRFDVANCLEVAEHLDQASAGTLIESLVGLADTVIFSAACPDQPGQHHVNCQWPAYWQQLFNAHGFACDDAVRWAIWDITTIEPWYRQNMFIAKRDPHAAGRERRIPSVRHPEMAFLSPAIWEAHARRIADGSMPIVWYLSLPFTAMMGKLSRRLRGKVPRG